MLIFSYIIHDRPSPLDEQDSKCKCFIFSFFDILTSATHQRNLINFGISDLDFSVYSGDSVFRVGPTGATLQIDRLIEIIVYYGMEMIVEKTEVMRISKLPSPIQFMID